jgi:HAD superfamily hydrolase (TIGR01509 family)
VIRLRQAGYRTGLLSNFWDSARQFWAEVYPFVENFDDIIISAEVGLMKPDPRVYHLAARRLGVVPAETLFVDDL